MLGCLNMLSDPLSELALARANPAVLDERLVPVRAYLADRGLKVDVGGR